MFWTNVRPCRHCHEPVSCSAKRCPRCDCPDPARAPGEMLFKILLGVCAIAWVVMYTVGDIRESMRTTDDMNNAASSDNP